MNGVKGRSAILFETLKRWVRQLLGKDLPSAVAEPNGKTFEDFKREARLQELRTNGAIKVPKAGRQASQKGYGKFMRHGKQSKGYRRSVKERVQPEDD